MLEMQILLWLFPILFMFHDFEEIIFMKWWIRKNGAELSQRFPSLAKKLLPHFESLQTASFALGVAEEFILISVITLISYLTNHYGLWIGLFIAFSIHLIIHIVQALIFRKYTPAIVTSLICLPFCLYILDFLAKNFALQDLVINSIMGIILMVINLIAVHKAISLFGKWLSKQS